MTPDEARTPTPTPAPGQAAEHPASGSHPPLAPHTLTDLFATARRRAVRPANLSPAYGIGQTVGNAIDDVRRGLDGKRLDPHVRYQLTHLLDALSTAVTETVRTVLVQQPAAEREPQVDEEEPKGRFRDRRGRGGGKRKYRSAAEAGRSAAPRPSPAPALDAVGKALPHVEKAFGKQPPTTGPPAPPWYEHDVMMELIQDLVSLRDRGRAERVWDRIGVFQELLRAQGIEILAYDPELRPERQADAFHLEQVTRDAVCRYETDLPALVLHPDGDDRRVLVRGRALRLPATTAGNPRTTAQGKENDR
ncbi:hypothetical protein [Streptomyces sp. AN091965]|uniref:hypothetical protein n=1 Tax=Streptomyces sp. AN091965 TaxID=2927803 RepID=UPI001F61B9EB|nr:hypothetical protein [Streptomyces sp. AN091965]MCI3935042.1 hypothetical protein [Streptomyces sp. AN091965]